MNCLFCGIAKDEIDSFTIYENDYVKCFLDINPSSDGETLIIPKKHYLDMYDIDEKYIIEINKAIKYILNLYDKVLKPVGYQIIQNNKSIQEIKHFHTHIVPFYDNNEMIKTQDIKNIFNKIQNN